MQTSPFSLCISPNMAWMRELLPAPTVPTTATSSPADTDMLMLEIVRRNKNTSNVASQLESTWYDTMARNSDVYKEHNAWLLSIQRANCRNITRLRSHTRHLPDSKVHGTNMRPTWVLSAPDGPHVGPMNLAIRVHTTPRTPATTHGLLDVNCKRRKVTAGYHNYIVIVNGTMMVLNLLVHSIKYCPRDNGNPFTYNWTTGIPTSL